MNYHFSFRAFSDQDQHIETIYSSKLSYGTHTWLSFIVELLTNLPSNSDGIYESQPPCRSFKLTLSFAETLTHYFLLKTYPRTPFAVQILVQNYRDQKSCQNLVTWTLNSCPKVPSHLVFCPFRAVTAQSRIFSNWFVPWGYRHVASGHGLSKECHTSLAPSWL